MVISETLPGQVFSYVNLMGRRHHLGAVIGLEDLTYADLQNLDEKFRLDVYKGEFTDMWHIGHDLDRRLQLLESPRDCRAPSASCTVS